MHLQIRLPPIGLLTVFTVEVLLLGTLVKYMALQIVLVFVRLGAGEAVVDLMGADQLPEERGREVGQAV
jgi:hypothetical protein